MSNKQTEALKLALEALEPFITPNWAGTGVDKANEAYAAIREALAEQPAQQWNAGVPPLYPEPEPGVSFKVAYEQPAQQQEPVNKYCCHLCFNKSGQMFLDRMILCPECGNKRCPKATYHELPCTNSNEPGQPGSIYTSPQPSKPWVGLTFAEICECESDYLHIFARAIETKLREKNNG